MLSVLQLLLIVFLNTVLFESIVANLVTVGEYPEINPKTCGLSRHSIGVGDSCFEWHKDVLSPIRGAQNVNLGDAPWVALLNLSYNTFNGSITNSNICTGSVIADQWILTAAHCLAKDELTIRIYLGHTHNLSRKPFDIIEYNSTDELKTQFLHPKYKPYLSESSYDMALLRMNKSINSSADPLLLNSICLPQKWSPIDGTDCHFRRTPNCKPTEYGLVAGWGKGLHPGPYNLEMGYWRLHNIRWSLRQHIHPNDTDVSKMYMKRLGTQQSCAGDSGAPVWQYDMGRAVIVGVRKSSYHDSMRCELDSIAQLNHTSFATFVDEQIDWIINVTMLN